MEATMPAWMAHHLRSLQVDVLQVAVMEVQVPAVSFLISELHQVWVR